ncbi:MAG: cyclic nucleotide-binding domain-containing protein [Sideroxydans sp.]|nr:cyclic nucleotide-binding domain-containing protein [Sideroxydans sp.]
MDDQNQINDDIMLSLQSFTQSMSASENERSKQMRDCSFFNPVPTDMLAELVSNSRVVKFAAGSKLTSEHDVHSTFYVLLYGTATVLVDGQDVGRILSGECLGESAFMGKAIHSPSATVVADCDLAAIEMNQTDIQFISPATQTFVDKALLLSLFKKLQKANRSRPRASRTEFL